MNRSIIIVGGAIAGLAATFAIRHLLAEPEVRRRLGLSDGRPIPHYGDEVDRSSEDSFPASDPPSFTATKATTR